MKLFGKQMDKASLLRRVGSMEQFAYARPFTYSMGKEAGIKAFEVSNGSGLDATVLESKCLDIVSMRYRGVKLNYAPKSGMVSPALADMCGTEFMKSISGGMLYTCGLLNVGAACTDSGIDQPFHGRMKNTPAEHVRAGGGWEGEEYAVRLSGEMREAAIFNENLVLRRELCVRVGENRVVLKDEVENQGFDEQEFMLLYHINIGYPVLDAGARILLPKAETVPKDAISLERIEDCTAVTEPEDAFVENVYLHRTACGNDGVTGAAVVNDALKLGVYIKYSALEMPNLVQWRSMRSGDYAMGLMPATCFVNGRAWEREHGSLRKIPANGAARFGVEIGVLDGGEDIRRFEAFINDLEGR